MDSPKKVVILGNSFARRLYQKIDNPVKAIRISFPWSTLRNKTMITMIFPLLVILLKNTSHTQKSGTYFQSFIRHFSKV